MHYSTINCRTVFQICNTVLLTVGLYFKYVIQYCWASLVTHMVKNLLAVQETWVCSLVLEDPCVGNISESGRSLGEGNGNPLQYSCLENLME